MNRNEFKKKWHEADTEAFEDVIKELDRILRDG